MRRAKRVTRPHAARFAVKREEARWRETGQVERRAGETVPENRRAVHVREREMRHQTIEVRQVARQAGGWNQTRSERVMRVATTLFVRQLRRHTIVA